MGKTLYLKEKRPNRLPEWKEYNLIFDLLNALALAKDARTVALLLRDLLTPKEVRNVAKRLQIARMLLAGEKYNEIADYLSCSLSTVAKVKMWLDTGGQGLQRVILKLPKKKEKPNQPRGRFPYNLPEIVWFTGQSLGYKMEEKQLKDFLDQMDDKGIWDKNFREQLAEEYREWRFQKKRRLSK